jgi:hypothetical protein
VPQVDSVRALARHAHAEETHAAQVVSIERRRARGLSLPEVSAEVRQEYAYAFAEREGLKIDSGMRPRCPSKEINPDCCAYHSTLNEVGCLEFFDHAATLPYVPGMVRAPAPAVVHRRESREVAA